jgi:hypothetical protein
MIRERVLLFLIPAAVFLLTLAYPSHAQNPPGVRNPPGPHPAAREPSKEDLAKMQMWIYSNLEKYLKLDEATSRRLKPIFIEYSETRGKLMREHSELSRRIMKDVEDESIPVADLKALMQRYKAITRSLWQDREKFYKRSEEILNDRQIVKLIIFEDKVKEDLFRRFRGERMGAPERGELTPAPGVEMDPIRVHRR